MHIIEKSVIHCPAAKVWPFIISPETFQKWNTKVISTEAKGRFLLGQTFVTHYRMSNKQIQCASTVTALQENALLELRHANCLGNGISPDLEVIERITLRESNGKTTVRKDVIVKNDGIPLIFRALIWFINRFGTSTEPNRLKELCEGLRSTTRIF